MTCDLYPRSVFVRRACLVLLAAIAILCPARRRQRPVPTAT